MQLAATQDKLCAAGVETLAVMSTPIERARLYFKYRPMRMPLLADPDVLAHRAFGLPRFDVSDGEEATSNWPLRTTKAELLTIRINPTGELPEPLPPIEAAAALNEKDGFELTEVDRRMWRAHRTQFAGHFLIDEEGVIRWTHVEARERLADLAKFPGEEEILAAARALVR